MGMFDSFRSSKATGTMAAGLGAAAPVWSVRWAEAKNLLRLRSLALSMMSLGTGFAAGSALFQLYRATAYTITDTDGAAIVPTKLRSGWADSKIIAGDMRISTTATLTAGTRVLDTDPVATLEFGITNAVNTLHLPTTQLWTPEDKPIILQESEGLVLEVTVPATGTWRALVTPQWEEWEPF